MLIPLPYRETYDKEFASSAAASRFKEPPHTGWPVVFFPPEMILHAKFHMIPVTSNTARREVWYVLDTPDHDACLEAARC